MKRFTRGALAALVLPVVAAPAYADECSAFQAVATPALPSGPLSLESAIRRAGSLAPEVLISALEARAANADADQAARPLNPVVSLELENFAGSGLLAGYRVAESTLSVEQTLRLGDKRKLAERAGRAEAALASAECRVQRRETELLAGELFLELEAAVDFADIANDVAALAEEFAGVVQSRVDAGAAAPPELSRARSEAASLAAVAEAARGETISRALALSKVWGSPEVDFELPGTPSRSRTREVVPPVGVDVSHPAIDAARAGAGARLAAAELAKASAYPDITVSAGVRQFEETGDSAVVAGVSLPFPLFDRNKDAARAASLRANVAQLSARAVEDRLRSEQANLAARVRTDAVRLRKLEEEALPYAEQAYADAAEGYRIGKFDLTATLDARRSLIETRAAVIGARLSLETETLRLRALVGAAPFDGEV
jgi:outer membrane protein, heavy metal efflux system